MENETLLSRFYDSIEPVVADYDRHAKTKGGRVSDADGAALSIAISLKRIADALENIATIQDAACPVTVCVPHKI